MNSVLRHYLSAAAACLAMSAAWPAHAEKADRDKPVQVEADRMHMDDLQKVGVYEGNVILTQGTMMLTAERIEVRQDDRGFAYGEAAGNPVRFRQKMDGSEEYVEGWANRVEYDARSELVKLIGAARLKRGEEELRGNLITYNARTEFYQAQGGASGEAKGRVRAVIKPKRQERGGPATPEKPAGAP